MGELWRRLRSKFAEPRDLPSGLFEAVLQAVFEQSGYGQQPPCVVQIGANDGVTNDPLHPCLSAFDVFAVLVEPDPPAFARLKGTYRGKESFVFLNAAIWQEDTSVTMYRIPEDRADDFRRLYKPTANPSGITSLSREHIELFLQRISPKHFQKHGFEGWIEAFEIEGITVPTLLNRYGLERVDLVQCDAEGYDAEIIRMVLDSSVGRQARVINFESKNLSDHEHRELRSLLVRNGYSMFRHGGDVCAFKRLVLE